MNRILVSVVMCVYNTPKEYLDEAVRSILNQTHKELELIIVDDASDIELYDDKLYTDTRIVLVRNDTNLGPAESRNRAFEIAKGKYIAIMDSDDISEIERLSRQIEYMENNKDVVACGTWFQQFGDKQNTVTREIDDNEYYRCCLLFGNAPTILNPSVMLRKSVLDEYEICYDLRLRKAEDYKMWVQLSAIGKCTNIHEVLLNYRVHNNQTSQILRTKDVSDYDWVVMKEQYDALGIKLSDEDEAMLRKDFRRVDVEAYTYFKWLQRLLEANKQKEIYQQDKLNMRIEEQWTQKIYNLKNPIHLLNLMKCLNKVQRKFVIQVEIQRTWNKITRKR